jgi:hypothetical protein
MLQARSLRLRARKKSDDLTTAIVLAGTSFPASAGTENLCSLRGSLLVRPSKFGSTDPHTMQDEPRRRRIRLLCGRLAAVRRDRRKRNADADRRT